MRGEDALREHDPGGIGVLDADLEAFRAALARESHTLKRALTDSRIFAGIGSQTGGRLLADRALSRLLRSDWPRTLEKLEERLPIRAARAASRLKERAR